MNIDHGARNSIHRTDRVEPRLRLDRARLTMNGQSDYSLHNPI
jgi:hypothetical protein